MRFYKILTSKVLLTLSIILTSLAFTSCDNDPKDEPIPDATSIIGTWEMRATDPDSGKFTTTLTFTDDGICTLTEVLDAHPSEGVRVTFDYTLEGDIFTGAKLTLIEQDSPDAEELMHGEFIATIHGNKLILLQTDEGSTSTFTKKN